jgi:hypothetical protein
MSDTASHQFLDAELTRRSQAGDAEAFGELITKYRVKIFTVVFSMVHNEYDAWDIAQEGFLCRATVFRGNGAGSATHYFVGTGAWGTG